jgi:hypothetical protein
MIGHFRGHLWARFVTIHMQIGLHFVHFFPSVLHSNISLTEVFLHLLFMSKLSDYLWDWT